jgi:hypothetical protein
MGMPMIIGAGVGALSSAAMGKSPFMGALLGGATGGAFGGAGGFGSGFTGAASGTGAGTSGVTGILGGNGEIGSSLLSSAPSTSGASFITGSDAIRNAASNIGTGLNFTPPTALETLGSNVGDTFKNIGGNLKDNFNNLSTMDKLNLGVKGYEAATPPPTQVDTSAQKSVTQGNPNMLLAPNFDTNRSSNLDTSLQIGQTKDNRMGLLDALKTRIPLTDEEKAQYARLRQQY